MDILKLIDNFIKKDNYIYFLDRNIISKIKAYNKALEESKKSNSEKLKKLKKELESVKEADQLSNKITPILSLFEGESGEIEYDKVLSKKALKQEVYHLKKFFSKAKVDDLSEVVDTFLCAKHDVEYIKDIKSKIEFLEKINEYIYQKLLPEKVEQAKFDIIKISEEMKLNKFHPVVVASLCTLYGDNICRGILKPKGNIANAKYYNAVLDLQHFSIFSMLSSRIDGNKYYCNKYVCKFLSLDKNLNEFFSWFQILKSPNKDFLDHVEIKFILSDKGWNSIPKELVSFFTPKQKQ